MMYKNIRIVTLFLLMLMLFTATSTAQVNVENMFPDEEDVLASAALMGADGEMIGGVVIAAIEDEGEMGEMIGVWAMIWDGLEPGYHAFHIHSVGNCEHDGDSPFSSAAGHFNPDGTTHGAHAGDLPSLYAMDNGGAGLIFITNAFTVEDLLDDDGSAFVIHAGRDNFANIPDRYGTPDDATLGAGDAGSRVACGVIEAGFVMEE